MLCRLVTICEGVDTSSPVEPSEVSGAAIELILDVTSKWGELNSDVSRGGGGGGELIHFP